MTLIGLAESGWLPDVLIRVGIRRLLRQRLAELADQRVDEQQFLDRLAHEPTAIHTDAANRQHYETPAWFYQQVLGRRMKYSCGYFENGETKLDEAEAAMLRLTCERADLGDGQQILELGCGWGSLTLWMAEHFPDAQITALSNSHSQRRFIEEQLAQRGYDHVSVVTADMRDYQAAGAYDRIVSVEMFEHMRNYRRLFDQVSRWLSPEGKLFVHVFCHRTTPYLFESRRSNDWMAQHFFTGGTMPSERLFEKASTRLTAIHQWRVDGLHYWRTAEAWLKNLDRKSDVLHAAFAADLGLSEARKQLQRWRMFFMACAELFRFRGGREWFVTHCLFEPSHAKQGRRQLQTSRASFYLPS